MFYIVILHMSASTPKKRDQKGQWRARSRGMKEVETLNEMLLPGWLTQQYGPDALQLS